MSRKKCKVCGSRNINRFFSSDYGRPPYYCSYKCMLIDKRIVHSLLAILFLFMAIGVMVYALFEHAEVLIFLSVVCFIACIYSFIAAHVGNKGHKEKLTADKRKRSIKRTRRATPYHRVNERTQETSLFLKNTPNVTNQEEIIVRPFKLITKNEIYICMVCKLEIRKNDIVYQCSQCNSYYHKEHLENWLKDSSSCPVCDYPLKLQ